MTTPEPESTAERLVRTVARQAETIHLQAETIAGLLERLDSLESDVEMVPPRGASPYLDGSLD